MSKPTRRVALVSILGLAGAIALTATSALSTSVAAAPPASGSTKPTPPADTADETALAKAEAAAMELGRTLKARVAEEMGKGGPGAAVEVCTKEAQQLTKAVTERTGVSVGRSSLRLRQPLNAPPAWVSSWLVEQGERPAKEAKPVTRVDSTPNGRMARIIRPIAVEPVCLVCHGAPETLSPEVKATLERAYPKDRATGYSVGDLRGALWAELPVEVEK